MRSHSMVDRPTRAMLCVCIAALALALTCSGQEPASGSADGLERARALFSQNQRVECRQVLASICAEGDGPAEAYSLLGLVLLDPPYGDPRGAYAAFVRAVTKDPRDLYGNFGLGLLLNRQAEHAKAAAVLERAVAVAPDYPECRHELGIALYQLGRLDEAATQFRAATSVPAAVEYLALIASRRQRHAEAADLVGALLQKMGPAWVERPRLLYQRAAFLVMAAQPAAARPLLTESVASGFVRAEALNELGRLAYEGGDAEAALDSYRRAAAAPSIYPDKPTREKRAHAASLFNVGVILYNRADYDGALAALRGAIELDAFHENAWYKYGQCLRKQGKKDEAKAAFDRHKAIQPLAQQVRSVRLSLPNDPDDHKTRFELSRLLEALGRYEEAIATLRELEHRKPDHPGLYEKLVEVCRKAGQNALAERYATRLPGPGTPEKEN